MERSVQYANFEEQEATLLQDKMKEVGQEMNY
jgi:hypothetical protein